MTPIVTDKPQQAATILQKSVCLSLFCHYLGNNRKVALSDLVDAATGAEAGDLVVDEEQFHATKKLIDSKELRPVMRVLGQVKRLLRKAAVSAHRVFGERSYLIPIGLVETLDAQLLELQAELALQATQLAYQRYAAAVATQREKLGQMFRQADYLTPAQVAEAFSIDWHYVSFTAPENLESVSHVLAARAHAQDQARLTRAFDEVLAGLRAEAIGVFTELVEKLGPGADGKPRVLRGTALRDLQDFATYLPHRNLAGDDGLAAIVAKVAARAQGLDVDDLRGSQALRDGLRQAAGEAKVALAELVETGRRGISFSGALAS